MLDLRIDLEALAARVMRPERPMLAEARGAVAGIVDPHDAWLALVRAGLLPSNWFDAPSRRFVARSFKRKQGAPSSELRLAGFSVQSHPARVDDAILVAASASASEAAEAHAREAARRVGADPEVPIVWRFAGRWSPTARRWRRTTKGYNAILSYCSVWSEADAFTQRFAHALRRASGMNGSVVGDVNMHIYWHLAAATDQTVRSPAFDPLNPWHRYSGRRFADVPNPIDPWISVWSLGFGIDAVRGDAIVLVAPRLGEPMIDR